MWEKEDLAFADKTYKVDIANTHFDFEKAKNRGEGEQRGKNKLPVIKMSPWVNWHMHY